MKTYFESTFPNITRWINEQGWLEIGADDYSSSMVRLLDEGGMVWESEVDYPSLDDALHATEAAIIDWMAGTLS